jgi:acyl-CoA reductase-like NAD-dependent aldehyde dehydrogenase
MAEPLALQMLIDGERVEDVGSAVEAARCAFRRWARTNMPTFGM